MKQLLLEKEALDIMAQMIISGITTVASVHNASFFLKQMEAAEDVPEPVPKKAKEKTK